MLGIPIACPKDGQPGEGGCLTLDAPYYSRRNPPAGATSYGPMVRYVRKGMQAEGQVPGPPTHTPAAKAWGQRTRIPYRRTGSRSSASAEPQILLTTARGASFRATSCRPHGRLSLKGYASSGVSDGSPRPYTRSHSLLATPRQTAQKTGYLGRVSAEPQLPLTKARGTPPSAPSCHPHSVQR